MEDFKTVQIVEKKALAQNLLQEWKGKRKQIFQTLKIFKKESFRKYETFHLNEIHKNS